MLHTIKHNNMVMKYDMGADGKSLKMYKFETEKTNSPDQLSNNADANFYLRTAGYGIPVMEGCGGICSLNEGTVCTSFKENKGGITAKYLVEGGKLEVTVKMQFIKGADAIRQINSVKNISKEKVTLTHFSSAVMSGIADGGLKNWYLDDSKIKVHHCLSHWQGEAQWREKSLDEIGIYKKTTHHWDSVSWRVRSIGSWSTGNNYPLVLVEDTESGTIWYMEIEGGFNWTIELGNRNGYGFSKGSFFMEANAADEETGFVKVLRPGETFVAAPAIWGCTDGSFDEAVKQLTTAKRQTTLAKWNKENIAPACFNDYMDCTWGTRDFDTMVPIIDKAAECGAELFCLDAGWFVGGGLGEWIVDETKYGKEGIKRIFDYIKSHGMIPGAWLEIESLAKNSPMYNNGAVMKRYGKEVSNGHFADFTDKTQCDYIEGVFDMLYNAGCRFVKNDYNFSTMLGCEIRGSSPAEGLKKHIEAFYKFIDKIQAKYPDLMIENCGSGAMRCDTGTLRHFQLQSTSDQEFYYLNPSIVSGSLAYLAPEKAGVWSYPYPMSFDNNQLKKDLRADKEYMDSMADGEETVFNMINALCGTLYLSGRIDCADEFNTKLIKEGVETFKKVREHNSKASAVWPTGHLSISNRTHSALGLLSPDGKKMTLAVWKFEDINEVIEIDLSKYFGGKKASCELVYPSLIDTEYCYNQNTNKLSVKLPKDRTARFFEISVK